MDAIRDILREKSIKVTPQRLQVYQALLASAGHMSVDDVYQGVKKRLPAISRATVYSVLEHLCQHGLINQLHIDAERIVYEARLDGHQHFMCTQCKRIYDIELSVCPALVQIQAGGHQIKDFHGYVYGICKTCHDVMSDCVCKK